MRLRWTFIRSLAVFFAGAALFAPMAMPMDPGKAEASLAQNQPASSRPDNNSYQGLIIEEIRFPDVVNPADQEHFRQVIPLKTGDPLDRERIRQSIQALHDTGRFADIQVEAERTPEGKAAIIVHTTPNYFFGSVDVEGNPSRPTPTQVVNASKLQLGELLTQEKIDRGLKSIKLLMEQNGYYQSTATADDVRHPETQQAAIVIHVTPGLQARVGSVTVTGDQTYSEQQIHDIAKMHPGDSVTAARVSGALERLRKKFQKQNRWLAQATIASQVYHAERNSVDYTFDIAVGPTVRIETQGFKVSRKVLKETIPIYQENALDDDLLNEGRRNLLNYLQSRGYFEAKVDYRKRRANAAGEMRIVYTIEAGTAHKLVQVEIVGNDSFPDLRSQVQIQPAGRFLSRGRFSQSLLNSDIRTLQNVYLSNGFLQAKITSEVLDDYQGKSNEVAVVIHVEEGQRTTTGELHFVGNEKISTDRFPALNIAPGQAFSESLVADDREIVLTYYANHGFPNATLDASATPVPGNPYSIDVTYKIREGQEITVDQVLISGLIFTKPFVIQREIQMKSGEPLSQLKMLRTQQQLYDLGIFSQVDTAVQNPDGQEPDKNVLVDLKEAKRYTFNYGVGLEFQTGQPTGSTNQAQGETGVSPRVSFDVTRLNFRGRNHTLSFKTHVGRLQQRGLIGYEAPRWFNNPDWKLSFTTYYDNTLDVTTFTSQRLEGTVQAEQVVSRTANGSPLSVMNYRFTYRRVQATNLVIDQDQVPLLSQPVRVGIPGMSFIRDKRDNPLETTRGNYTTIDTGVASGYFGSETDFSRILIQNSTYYAFGKNRRPGKQYVFARSTRIGVETPFNNTVYVRPGETFVGENRPIPLPELFLAGGGNSHRGFGLNQAGPRDPKTGFPLGGASLFLNNLELRFPAMNLPFVGDNMSFAIFHDAGNVFDSGHDMLHNLLRWRQKNPNVCLQDLVSNPCDYSYVSHAIGVGVRYKTPIGPVRFDFGYNLNPPAFPSCVSDQSFPNQPVSANCQALQTGTPYFEAQHARHFNIFFSIGQTF